MDNALIVDDHPIFVDGLAQILLGLYPNAEILKAYNAEEAKAKLEQFPEVDVIFLDIHMPGVTGKDFLTELSQLMVVSPVVVLSGDQSPKIIHEMFELGASAYLPKSVTQQYFQECINSITGGLSYVPTELKAELTQYRDTILKELDYVKNQLGRRQHEVLDLMAKGMSNVEISAQLNIAMSTVKAHISNIMTVFDVSNRTACVARARELGLID